MFPKDEAGFAMDDQYYIGSSGLLVKPVTQKGEKETSVYLAEDQVRSFSLPYSYSLTPRRSTTTTLPNTLTAALPKVAPSLSRQIYTKSRSSYAGAPSFPHASARDALRR